MLMNDSVNNEDNTPEPPKTRWTFSLDWLQTNHRSATLLISEHLCPKCAVKFAMQKKSKSPEELIKAIQNCCSRTPEFINHRLPVLESVFRLFLSTGNQPLEPEEVGQQLSQLCGGDSFRASPEVLLYLMQNDHYYGFREVTD